MTRLMRYIIGLIVIAVLFFIALFHAPESLIYSGLPHLGFLKRALFVLILCSILCLYRVIKGPTAPDRIVAIDIFGILIIGFCAVLTVSTKRSWYIDIGIAWSLQSFISTLAFAKYFEGKDFDD